jgi:hypothetical protein
MAPRSEAEPAVVWAILRALGKRIEQLDRTKVKVWWMDAERWVVAHRVSEIVVLCAQHLGDRVTEELKEHVCGRLRIALMLVYGGPARTAPPATTTLDGYLAQQHRPPSAHVRCRPWPQVPRSHPLRLRYDCRQQLTPEEFARVERLLVGSLRTMGGRWWPVGYVARPEIRSGLCVVGAAEDPEQAYVRRCAAELALICDQSPIPLVPPLALRPRLLTTEDIDAIRAYVDPAAAGYQLAKRITGLRDGLVALIGGDQITDSAILGCIVPEPVRPILRAVDDRSEPVLQVPDMAAPEPIIDTTPPEEEVAVALGRLLQRRNARIRPRKLPPQLRSRFQALRADGILDRSYGAYRASHIALYSSFMRDEPPTGSL